MKVALRLVVLGLAVAPGLSFGFPGMSEMENEIRAKLNSLSPAAKADCTDFSGTWVGKCSSNAGEKDATIKIEQHGCEQLKFDDNHMHFGGLSGGFSTNTQDVGEMKVSMDWNQGKKTTASINGTTTGRQLGKNNWFNGTFRGNLAMAGEGALMTQFGYQWKLTMADGESYIGGGNHHCILKKQ